MYKYHTIYKLEFPLAICDSYFKTENTIEKYEKRNNYHISMSNLWHVIQNWIKKQKTWLSIKIYDDAILLAG